LDSSVFARQERELPWIDEHSAVVDGDPERVWDALVGVVGRSFGDARRSRAAAVLGCEDTGVGGPPFPAEGATVPGFHVASSERPRLLALHGRHRFSRYALTFRIEPAGPGGRTRVRAETRAVFPGLAGGLYRAAVIGTRGHVLAVRSMLRGVERRVAGGAG
jgi:hypothetical protein